MAIRNVVRTTNYDTIFEPAKHGKPARLRLRLMVALRPRDPSVPEKNIPSTSAAVPVHLATRGQDMRTGWLYDYDGKPFQCRSMLQSEFNTFQIKFKRAVELSWDNQLFLLPPVGAEGNSALGDRALTDDEYRQFVDDPGKPARVVCELEVVLTPWSQPAHAPIEVVHLLNQEQKKDFRSFFRRILDTDWQFRLVERSKWSKIRIYQITAAHEVGHWLRGYDPETGKRTIFDHVDRKKYEEDVAAGKKPKGSKQYGYTMGHKLAMMGEGNTVTDHEARVFLAAIARHTGVLFGWQPIHRVHYNNNTAKVSDRQKKLVGRG